VDANSLLVARVQALENACGSDHVGVGGDWYGDSDRTSTGGDSLPSTLAVGSMSTVTGATFTCISSDDEVLCDGEETDRDVRRPGWRQDDQEYCEQVCHTAVAASFQLRPSEFPALCHGCGAGAAPGIATVPSATQEEHAADELVEEEQEDWLIFQQMLTSPLPTIADVDSTGDGIVDDSFAIKESVEEKEEKEEKEKETEESVVALVDNSCCAVGQESVDAARARIWESINAEQIEYREAFDLAEYCSVPTAAESHTPWLNRPRDGLLLLGELPEAYRAVAHPRRAACRATSVKWHYPLLDQKQRCYVGHLPMPFVSGEAAHIHCYVQQCFNDTVWQLQANARPPGSPHLGATAATGMAV
jgi:hypothetical protein